MPHLIKPLAGKVLLAPAARRAESVKGIFIPETYQDPTQHDQYFVLAVGPGRRNKKGVLIEPDVQKGDYVLFSGDHDHQTMDDGRKLVDARQLLCRWRISE